MSSSDDDSQQRFALGFLFALIALVISAVVGTVVVKRVGASGAAKPAATAVASSAPAAPVAAAVADEASVRVENGVVKFYFASGKADLAPGALVALGDAIAAAKAGKRLVLSGFHDATGDPAFNAELAKQRALAVRDALVQRGLPVAAIEVEAWGARAPVLANDTPEGRAGSSSATPGSSSSRNLLEAFADHVVSFVDVASIRPLRVGSVERRGQRWRQWREVARWTWGASPLPVFIGHPRGR